MNWLNQVYIEQAKENFYIEVDSNNNITIETYSLWKQYIEDFLKLDKLEKYFIINRRTNWEIPKWYILIWEKEINEPYPNYFISFMKKYKYLIDREPEIRLPRLTDPTKEFIFIKINSPIDIQPSNEIRKTSLNFREIIKNLLNLPK